MTDHDGWLRTRWQRDAQLLQATWPRMRAIASACANGGGSLRIMFIDGTPTAPTARAVDRIHRHGAARDRAGRRAAELPSPVLPRAERRQSDDRRSQSRAADVFGGRLLADGSHALEPDARRSAPRLRPAEDPRRTAPPATGHTASRSRALGHRHDAPEFPHHRRLGASASWSRCVRARSRTSSTRPTSPSRFAASSGVRTCSGTRRCPASTRALHFRRARRQVVSAPTSARSCRAPSTPTRCPVSRAALSAVGLKSFLSDMGVGVDCSGFVSQALNACMAAFDRSERIDTNSREPARRGRSQPAAVRRRDRPRDLMPGDTMWKTGHIRIIHRVEPQADGSIQFVTAESSSVDLIGAVAKTWKCPQADRFASIAGRARRQLSAEHRGQRLQPVSAARRRPSRGTAGRGEDARWPPPAPTAADPCQSRRHRHPFQLRRRHPRRPARAAPATPGSLTQPEIDRLARIEFASAADIDTFCSRRGAAGFAGWFNTQLCWPAAVSTSERRAARDGHHPSGQAALRVVLEQHSRSPTTGRASRRSTSPR